MSVRQGLIEAKGLLVRIRTMALPGLSEWQFESALRALDRAIERYGKESKRVSKWQLGSNSREQQASPSGIQEPHVEKEG